MLVRIPKFFGITPFFTLRRIANHKVSYMEFNVQNTINCPISLTPKHAQVLIACLILGGKQGRITLNAAAILRTCYMHSKAGRLTQKIRRLLQEIHSTTLVRHKPNTTCKFKIIEELQAQSNPMVLRFSDSMMAEILQPMYLRWDYFCRIRSKLSRCLYLYMPARAANHTEPGPWRIQTDKLSAQIGLSVMLNSRLRSKYYQKALPWLDGAPMNRGCLRILLVPRPAHDLLKVWLETSQPSQSASETISSPRMREVWIRNGGSLEAFQHRMHKPTEMSIYAQENLERMHVNVEKDRSFLLGALRLLGGIAV